MVYYTASPNMDLTIPNVGLDAGPDYAVNVNNSLTIVDGHDHSTGRGVQINPAGININTDLTFNNNNGTYFRSVRFQPQGSPLALASDIGCLYENGVDLYYNDGLGNQIRLTVGGGISGTPGSITNLGTATVNYVSASSTFVFRDDTSAPANLDIGYVIFRDNTVGSHGLTMVPPAAMAADYQITLPALPAVQSFMTLDASGNEAAPWTVDGTTVVITANEIGVSPSYAQSLTPSGVITAFGGASAPTNWLLCDGTSYLRTTYASLFAAIGTAYGTADSTHFNVPDLRGQFLRGVDAGAGRDPDTSSRTAMNAGGNTGDNVGSIEGSTFGSHTHGIDGSESSGGGQLLPIYNSNSGPASQLSSTLATGGSETRPINAYVNFIIKV